MHIIFYFILSIKYTKRDFFLFFYNKISYGFTYKYVRWKSPSYSTTNKANTILTNQYIDMEKASTKFVFLVALLIIASC